MFGGLSFLVAGKIAVAASSQGGLLVRVDPACADRLLATTNARSMERKGRAIQGWLHVDGDDLRTKRQLTKGSPSAQPPRRVHPPRDRLDDRHPGLQPKPRF